MTSFVRDLSHEYERLHTAKEDAFWTAYMGLSGDADAARDAFDRLEVEWQQWLQDPARLARVRAELAGASDADERTALEGWERTLLAHVIESEEGRALSAEIVEMEGRLARARNSMRLGYEVEGGEFVEASSVRLGVMIKIDPDAARRRAAWKGLKSIETHVLENGFLEVVAKRNELGRMLGGEDFYDWKVKRTEKMSKREVFALLDELEEKTRESARRSLDEIRAEQGDDAIRPWNLSHAVGGDVSREQDPYFPFAHSLERWGRSFAALGIDYRGADMVLDLVDRKGKHENGFMHGPVPAWRDRGELRPARIQFTANAIPGMVGSGKNATATLFHEGGHAAHFANIDMPAPCFAQEFAPTSVALAEVQSMFLDSILEDADWQERYAQMPTELIEKGIRARQRFAAGTLRGMLCVPYCERAIYEIAEGERTAERVLEEIRATESRLLFLDEGSPRPALSIPHLLAGEGSAYYHGYIVALMGVHQTRDFFLARDGHLMDNPRIGPDLRDTYWRPGNSKGFLEMIESMTGKPLSADPLADFVNKTQDEAVAAGRAALERAKDIPHHRRPVALGARIRVSHGNEIVASTEAGGFDKTCRDFAAWITDVLRADAAAL